MAEDSDLDDSNVALVAIGGYGRRELCAYSDLDVLMLHRDGYSADLVSKTADSIWYPIWDAGVSLDHSVRNSSQVKQIANQDFKVVLGLLDARLIAGNPELLSEIRSQVLTDWRNSAKSRLEELRASATDRKEKFGELSYLLEPELKESYGGLRESTILRAISASWITDIDKEKVEKAHSGLLLVRDALHRISKRSNDRLSLFEQDEVANFLQLDNADDLLKRVYESGRTLAFESDSTWARASKLLQQKSFFISKSFKQNKRTPLASGVVVQEGEAVLARDVDLRSSSALIWRIAGAAAQAGIPIAQSTVDFLSNTLEEQSEPWDEDKLSNFVSFLGAGSSMLPIWESLDQAGLIERLIPHWSGIRYAPQRNALHIYTVDRHNVECAIEAAKLTREVTRPDLLLVGALFHDIGKARGGDHSQKGKELMVEIGPALGFNVSDSHLLEKMVEYHLLIPEVATRRDLDDVETINYVAEKIENNLLLELLHNLAIADSKATSPHNWSDWKSNLIQELVDKVFKVLQGKEIPDARKLSDVFPFNYSTDTQIKFELGRHLEIMIQTQDRLGLVADVSAALRVLRLEVLAAKFETENGIARQLWSVRPLFGEVPDLKQIEFDIFNGIENPELVNNQINKFVEGRNSYRGFVPPKPVIRFVANTSVDILEVRAHDEPALLFRLSKILVKHNSTISTARIDTMGSEVIDVLYLQNVNGEKLSTRQKTAIVQDIESELLPKEYSEDTL